MKIIQHILILLLFTAATVFAGDDHDHGDGDHDHAAEATTDHGHDHGDDGDHAHGEDDGETRTVTLWSEQMELFMKYPLLTANQPGEFAIHLTILDGFRPVRDGAIRLIFITPDGHEHSMVETDLVRDGVFAPTVDLHDVGDYRFALVYNGPEVRDSFNIDGFSVYASADNIPHAEHGAIGDEINFLKEQQWKIPFATADAEVREVKRSVWAIGEVLPSPNAYVEIVSPVDGLVQIGQTGRLALPGSNVARGATVATITPPVQGQGWASSRLAFEQAKRDYERAQRLKERQAISEREFERIRNEYLSMKAGFESVSGSGEDGVLELHAPINGKIIEWQVRPGQRVNAGDKLMAIVDPATVWLRVNVYENDFRNLGQPVGAYVKSDADAGGWNISETDMKVLTTGGAFDPITRTVPVLLEVANQSDRLKVHETTPVELYASDGISATAVPKGAIYEDDGMDVVYVQTGGETFEKRIVSVGPHYAGWVAITDGLQPGERVVTTGGYQVKLSASTAEIGHGHAH